MKMRFHIIRISWKELRVLVKSVSSEIIYCSVDCALLSGEREEDLEQYEPESSAFTAQCVGCGELV